MRVVGIVALGVVSLACDSRPLAPQTGAGRLGFEGLPTPPAPTATSAWCIVTFEPGGAAITASWDAPTRTFTYNGGYWTVDAAARVVEEGETDGRWRILRSYDARGTPTSYRYEEQGQLLYHFDQKNDYDGGRLLGSERAYTTSTTRASIAYEYEGEHLTSITEKTVLEGQAWGYKQRLVWNGDRVVAREWWGSATVPDERDARAYDAGGRLQQADTDFGFTDASGTYRPSDGTTDVRTQWTTDEEGRITRLEQDGLFRIPPEGLDGAPDYSVVFEPACADIAVVPRALYQLESWLAPQ